VTVFVEAAARLHFGVLDLRGGEGRWFGGLGAAAPGPTVRVRASLAPESPHHRAGDGEVVVTGEQAPRAREFARRFLAAHGLPPRARIHVERALPAHAGLGSGTQLALSVARALAGLYGVAADAADLARAVGRGRRSAVGLWTFVHGGLVVEGGRRRDGEACGPLLARMPLPEWWHWVVATPSGEAPSGAAEEAAFEALTLPPEAEAHRVAYTVLARLLPAAAARDLGAFGAALTAIQEITGAWWAPVQGGTFSPMSRRLIEGLREGGAVGVGQSSWGPTVYGVVDGAQAATCLADRLRRQLGPGGGVVISGPVRNEGARVWEAADSAPVGPTDGSG
jgi:beta-RFAP synthase